MKDFNAIFAHQLLFTDPETGEELWPKYEPMFDDDPDEFVFYVTNKDGSRNWKHTIKTEEM